MTDELYETIQELLEGDELSADEKQELSRTILAIILEGEVCPR